VAIIPNRIAIPAALNMSSSHAAHGVVVSDNIAAHKMSVAESTRDAGAVNRLAITTARIQLARAGGSAWGNPCQA
jgi:hypothetical protein